MVEITRGLQRAALTYALRDGWTPSERQNLADARDLVKEILDAYYGALPEDLLSHYGNEYADAIEGFDE